MNRILNAATVTGLVLGLGLHSARAEADSTLSEASELCAVGAASLVAGSMMAIVGSVELVVESVEWLADGARCGFNESRVVGHVVLLLPVKAAGGVSLAMGQTVRVTTAASGWLLTKAGEVVAFIPNESGRALLLSEPVK